MKAPPFDYHRPRTIDETIEALQRYGGDAKLLAGGQSLMPMMNFRLLAPAVLVDINHLPDLDNVHEAADGLRIGALTRLFVLETSNLVRAGYPIVTAAMRHVAHLAIRNRGTIGGSISHADPAAELPMLLMLLDAAISVSGPGSSRTIAAKDFFHTSLVTDLAENELVTDIILPPLSSCHGWGFQEVARRAGDFALAAVGTILQIEDGFVKEARIGLMGVAETPLRVDAAEQMLIGEPPSADLFAAAGKVAQDIAKPESDLHASADYRRHLIAILTKRALAQAV